MWRLRLNIIYITLYLLDTQSFKNYSGYFNTCVRYNYKKGIFIYNPKLN